MHRTRVHLTAAQRLWPREIAGPTSGTPFAMVACYREEVAMAGSDMTIEILKGMRKEMRERFDSVDKRLNGVEKRLDVLDERLDLTVERLDIMNERLDVVESTLLTLARQQRMFMKHAGDLEGRIGKLERR
jgi:hypothetical protein